MTPPRAQALTIRGWRCEFRTWWLMAKHVDVVFDKSHHGHNHNHNHAQPLPAGPGSISICRDCCQILSTRSCSGQTTLSATGCDYHTKHPDVPIAVKSVIVSVRLREMWRPQMAMVLYFLEPGKTDLMDVGWVRGIREGNSETRRDRKRWVHEGNCVWGQEPESVVQGKGVEGVYFRRCDGRWVNGVGGALKITGRDGGDVSEALDEGSMKAEKGTEVELEELDTNLAIKEAKIAEMAWKRKNPAEAREDEEESKPKRRLHCIVM